MLALPRPRFETTVKRLFALVLVGCLAFLCTGAFASGAFAATPSTQPQYHSVEQLRFFVEAVDDLKARSVLTESVAKDQYDYYASQASAIRGEEVSVAQLRAWNRVIAFFRVGTVVQIIVGLLIALGTYFFLGGVIVKIMELAGSLLLKILVFIGDVITSIPVPIYELGLCGFGVFLMITEDLLVVRLLGALIFGSSLTAFHGVRSWKELESVKRDSVFIAGVSAVAYGICAVVNQSIALGVLASLSFVSFFGFQTHVGTLTLALGFESEDQMASGTLAAGLLTIFGVVLAQGLLPSQYAVLQTGALFAGGLVYFIGLDILSSKWYANSNYIVMQVLTTISGLAGIYAGTFYEVGVLTAVAGTLFVIYLLEKYVELCSYVVRNRIAGGLALLGAAGILAAAWRAVEHFIALSF
jgi:hypothetical protein